MGRSRYKIYEPTHPHFVTCTILNWIPIFTRQETTQIVFDSLNYLKKSDNLNLYAYVILENHLHMIINSDDLSQSTYQLWQEGFQLKLIQSEKMFIDRVNYIHYNPVKRGYVDEAKHWRYSSARDYEGKRGLIDIERVWFV